MAKVQPGIPYTSASPDDDTAFLAGNNNDVTILGDLRVQGTIMQGGSAGVYPGDVLVNSGHIRPSEFKAQNTAPLDLVTPDGTGDITHPSVVFAPGGWNGYRYWMAATPYHATNSQLENPCIWASNDGDTWVVPNGLTNPIEPAPDGGNYNSDTDLVFSPDAKTLYCVWRQYVPGSDGERIYYRSSTDGVHWSPKVLMIATNPASERNMSPAVLYDPFRARSGLPPWMMWTVEIVSSPNTVKCWTASAIDGPWLLLGGCSISSCQDGKEPWHLDVIMVNDYYVMLLNDTILGQSGANGRLYLGYSTDGINWTVSTRELLDTNTTEISFYRSTLAPSYIAGDVGFELWYAAIRNGGVWRVSHTQIRNQLQSAFQDEPFIAVIPQVTSLVAAVSGIEPFVIGDAFVRADSATSLGSTPTGDAWTTEAGTFGVLGKRAYAPVEGNTRASVTVGLSDGYFEVTFDKLLYDQAWLVFREVDTQNFSRLGMDSNQLKLQRVVAGAISNTINIGRPYSSGSVSRLGVCCNGDLLTVYQDGVVVGTFTDPANKTGVKAGIQTAQTTARFHSFLARKLVGGR